MHIAWYCTMVDHSPQGQDALFSLILWWLLSQGVFCGKPIAQNNAVFSDHISRWMVLPHRYCNRRVPISSWLSVPFGTCTTINQIWCIFACQDSHRSKESELMPFIIFALLILAFILAYFSCNPTICNLFAQMLRDEPVWCHSNPQRSMASIVRCVAVAHFLVSSVLYARLSFHPSSWWWTLRGLCRPRLV